MKIIFGTTNARKVEDLEFIIQKYNLDLEVLTLADICWDRGEIEENGQTLEENSLIKARAIYDYCKDNNITYPIITDDAGLFVDSLNGEPGIYTAHYADAEIKNNPSLPRYECVNKLLRKLDGAKDRGAEYRCVVTCMDCNGDYFQTFGISKGNIAEEIVPPLVKPYFYSVFILLDKGETFNLIPKEELCETYRYKALKKALKRI